jgi:putative ABC transport system permease protein
MLSFYFIKWVVLAFIIACPVAWLFAGQWLRNFSVQVDISWVIFLVAGITATALTLITVLYQAWKAAMMNPVDTLRNE